jgi:hypothetical protein
MESLLVQKRLETVNTLWKAIETAALYKRKEILSYQADEDKVRGFFDRFARGDLF